MIIVYPKINTLFKRTEQGTLLVGEYTDPEVGMLKNIPWDCYEKVDGMQCRVMFDGKKVTTSGRKDGSTLPEGVAAMLKKRFPASAFKKHFDSDCREICLYLECYGNGVRETRTNYGMKEKDFALFDVMVHDWWLQPFDVDDVVYKLGCNGAPFRFRARGIDEIVYTVAAGFGSDLGRGNAEGIIAYPAQSLKFRNGQRVMFKLKTRDFDNARFCGVML